MPVIKTPGVDIVGKNAFPNSVVEVATAVPAFVGYTEKADNGGKSLANPPWRIASLAEYHRYFGAGPAPRFEIRETPDAAAATFKQGAKSYVLTQQGGRYLLYYGIRQFFQNGGGPCHVVSVGGYGDPIDAMKLEGGIEALVQEAEPTLVVVPECVLLDAAACTQVQQAMLAHCGKTMRNRVAILDIRGGDRSNRENGCIDDFRGALGVDYLDFAAAYYPWLRTTTVQDGELNYSHIATAGMLIKVLAADLQLDPPPASGARPANRQSPAGSKEQAQRDALEAINKTSAQWLAEWQANAIAKFGNQATAWMAANQDGAKAYIRAAQQRLDQALGTMSSLYKTIIGAMKDQVNLLPPGPTIAGIYAMVDSTRGVWKAPANVSLAGVVAPAVSVSAEEQDELNVTPQGKSINAIRTFAGEGVLVWGARTLDGNSTDWRYVNVRRTAIMIEESCRLALRALVFEPNVAGTWVTVKSMIGNFLSGIWKSGGLAGATPQDAFGVRVGLGETMTQEDVDQGILRVTLLVAISRPAEFVEITIQQQMQKS